MLNGSLTEEEKQIICELNEITKQIYKQYKHIRKSEINKRDFILLKQELLGLNQLVKEEKEIYNKISKDRVMYFLGYYFNTQDTTQIFLMTDNYNATEFYKNRVVLELINILYSTNISIIHQFDQKNNILDILVNRFNLAGTNGLSAIRSINIGNEIERDLKRMTLLFLQRLVDKSKNSLIRKNLIVNKYNILFNDRYLESEVLLNVYDTQNIYLSSRLCAEFFNIPEEQYYRIKDSIVTRKWIETANELLNIKDYQFERCLGHVLFLQCQLRSELLLMSKDTSLLFFSKLSTDLESIKNKENRKILHIMTDTYHQIKREKEEVKILSFGKYKRTM